MNAVLGRIHPVLVVLVALLVGLGGCAGPVEVTRTFTPTAASRVDADKLRPVAVIREDVSFPVPAGSRVEADQIVRRDGQRLALQPTDAVVMRGMLAPDETIPEAAAWSRRGGPVRSPPVSSCWGCRTCPPPTSARRRRA